MKKLIKYFALIIVIGLVFFAFRYFTKPKLKENIPNENVVQTFNPTLTIELGNDTKNFDITGFIGKTALEATESDAKVVTNGTGVNAFVTSIAGKTADTKKHEFWEFDVNGNEASVGAGSYVIKGNDKIVWRISTY